MSSFIPVNRPLFAGNERKYLNECIDTGWVSSEGPFVERFENDFKEYIGMPYAVAVTSGSAALDLAFELLNLEPGDEIILPTFTIISPVLSILKAKAIPVFVDSDPLNWNLNVHQIESKITTKTKAILVVHTYGLAVDMDPVLKIAQSHGLYLIEDAAEVHGQTYKHHKCGSIGDISIFSFYANKNINTGEGGMVLLKDPEKFKRAKRLRNLSFDPDLPRFVHHELGWNYRMTNLQAALGVAQFEVLNKTLELKLKIGVTYQSRLKFLKRLGFTLPLETETFSKNQYWVFGFVCPNLKIKVELIDLLEQKKIGYRPFFWCMHEQPVFKNYSFYGAKLFPNAENLARLGLYLPSGVGLNKSEQIFICKTIEEKYG